MRWDELSLGAPGSALRGGLAALVTEWGWGVCVVWWVYATVEARGETLGDFREDQLAVISETSVSPPGSGKPVPAGASVAGSDNHCRPFALPG